TEFGPSQPFKGAK
nr:RecName: Full=Adenosylhomocysteinase 1; Short=AdoHcyase; AltName: Full=S-adenosyl-L-homocysteine hydrolase [Populus euphratica]